MFSLKDKANKFKQNTLNRARSSQSFLARKSILVAEKPFYEPVKLEGHQNNEERSKRRSRDSVFSSAGNIYMPHTHYNPPQKNKSNAQLD